MAGYSASKYAVQVVVFVHSYCSYSILHRVILTL